MKKPTPPEIAADIAALQKLRPVGDFKHKTAAEIAIAIDTLKGEVDDTAEEFNELTEQQRDISCVARRWLDGDSPNKPSQEGWDHLCG